MSWLLDVNLLLASRWTTHVDHVAVRSWLDEQAEFHTTPIVELGFMRVSLSPGYSATWQDAHRSLLSLYSRAAHRFLADDLSATDSPESSYKRHHRRPLGAPRCPPRTQARHLGYGPARYTLGIRSGVQSHC